MKTRGWVTIWAALLLICVVAGIFTRQSFTNITADQEALKNSYYDYRHWTEGLDERLSLDLDSLQSEAECIVKAKFTGSRTFENYCTLCELVVSEVYAGDSSLLGSTIGFYEDIHPRYSSLEDWSQHPDYELYAQRVKKDGKEPFLVLGIWSKSFSHIPPLKDGNEYILFLTEKQYPKEMDRTGKPREFSQADNLYAVVPVSIDGSAFVPAPYPISWKEANEYNILLPTKEAAEIYLANRKTVLDVLQTGQ